jgi:hypothetical protein
MPAYVALMAATGHPYRGQRVHAGEWMEGAGHRQAS